MRKKTIERLELRQKIVERRSPGYRFVRVEIPLPANKWHRFWAKLFNKYRYFYLGTGDTSNTDTYIIF